MAYEPGTYLKELEADHRAKEHDQTRHEQCPDCRKLDDLEYAQKIGFKTLAEYDAFLSESAMDPDPEMVEAIDRVFVAEHELEKHKKYPSKHCSICIEMHGINNI